MNIKQIKELAQLLKQNDLSALEVIEGDNRVRIERDVRIVEVAQQAPQQTAAPQSPQAQANVPAGNSLPADAGIDFNHVRQVKSPLVGVFYAAASPESEPFVKIGSKIQKGDVLCIVEAMKLMNEILAEEDGEIVDICVQNGEVVEFGQTLFKLN